MSSLRISPALYAFGIALNLLYLSGCNNSSNRNSEVIDGLSPAADPSGAQTSTDDSGATTVSSTPGADYSECATEATVPPQVSTAMQTMRLVSIGEMHGGISFSPLQTVQVFKSAFCTKKRISLVMEMISSAQQDEIDSYLNGQITLDALDNAVQLSALWYGGQPYRDILEWAKNHAVAVYGGDLYDAQPLLEKAEQIMAPVVPSLEQSLNGGANSWDPMLAWEQENWYRDQEMARVSELVMEANSSGLTLTYTGIFHASTIPALIDPQIPESEMAEVLLGAKNSDPSSVASDDDSGEPSRVEIGNMNWVGPWPDQPHISWVFAKAWKSRSAQ